MSRSLQIDYTPETNHPSLSISPSRDCYQHQHRQNRQHHHRCRFLLLPLTLPPPFAIRAFYQSCLAASPPFVAVLLVQIILPGSLPSRSSEPGPRVRIRTPQWFASPALLQIILRPSLRIANERVKQRHRTVLALFSNATNTANQPQFLTAHRLLCRDP
ncbi:hypothetical protein F5X99DRAFT_223695 [Biscogniauxia marginata]|nr:hypothetical protein F5X99DRAFT_223695 [Biscogniauxia marginata]